MTKKEYIERYGEEKWLIKKTKKAEYDKKYSEEHKEHIKERIKNWTKKNKDVLKERRKGYHTEYRKTINGKAHKLLNGCIRFDKKHFGENVCDLTYEYISEKLIESIGKKCHYCNTILDIENISIDRMDSTKPHTIDNCVFCCKSCNYAKQEFPYEEYIAKIRGNQL